MKKSFLLALVCCLGINLGTMPKAQAGIVLAIYAALPGDSGVAPASIVSIVAGAIIAEETRPRTSFNGLGKFLIALDEDTNEIQGQVVLDCSDDQINENIEFLQVLLAGGTDVENVGEYINNFCSN